MIFYIITTNRIFFYLVNYCQIDQSLTTVQVFSELRSHEIHQKANYFSTLTTYIF